MRQSLSLLFATTLASAAAAAGKNLLLDGGFEGPLKGSPWKVSQGTLRNCTRPGPRTGTGAVSIRALDDGTLLRQPLPALEVDTPYHVLAYVYLPKNTKCVLGADNFQCPYAWITSDGEGIGVTSLLSATPNAWNAISGQVFANSDAVRGTFEFVIGGLIPGETLCFDDASVTRTSLEDFRPESDAMISALRQRDVVLKMGAGGSAKEPVRIVQNKLAYPIGSAIAPAALAEPKYKAFFEEHFNICVDEYGMATAWDTGRTTSAAYTTEVLDYCDSIGYKTRGHTADGELANWYSYPYLLDVNRDGTAGSIQQLATDRLNEWVKAYGKRIIDIEAINEMLNGRFWPSVLPCGATGACICDYAPACPDALFPDKKISVRAWAHATVKALLPDLPIYVNEYCMLGACGAEQSNPSTVIKFVQALDAESKGAIGGFAEQGHMYMGNSLSGPDMLLKFQTLRDKLGPDIKFYVSELDVDDPDMEARANGYEMIMRALFASPVIEGIMFWGFWQLSQWRKDSYLVNSDWSLNPAGERIFGADGLLSKQWRTTVAATVDGTDASSVNFRGFHGSYTVYYGADDRCAAQFAVPVGTDAVTVAPTGWVCKSGAAPAAV